MDITSEKVGDVTVVVLEGDHLDASNTREFKRDLTALLPPGAKVVMDLGKVQFVDSSGCGALLSCLKTLTENHGDLKICQVNKYVRQVFDLIRLHRICDVFDTRDEAVKAFAAKV